MMSTDTSNKSAGATSRISLLNLFLLFIATLQGSSQVLALFFPPENTSEPVLLKVWLSLGTDMSENWVAISIFLIILVLGSQLYNILYLKSSSPHSGLKSVGFLLINLALCLRVYSSDSISDKISYLAAHLPTVIIISIITFFVAVTMLMIQKERRNTEELHEHYQRVNTHSKSATLPEDSDANEEKATNIPYDPETAFRLEHPFSYAYRSFVNNFSQRQEIKREHKKLTSQTNTKAERQKGSYNPEDKWERIFSYFSVGFALCACIALGIFIFNQDEKSGGLEVLRRITDYILNITGILDSAKGPLTNFLLSSGVLFLFVILILTFFLLLYISLRVIVYLITHPVEDTARINRIGKAIKTFVLGILDGALRPLLFLPDFLECVEEMLLDSDMDGKISEMYPSVDPLSESTGTSTPEEDCAEHTDPPGPLE